MLQTACSGCEATFVGNNYRRWTISISLSSPEGVPLEEEVSRQICDRCMARMRPSLDVIDGKADYLLEERMRELETKLDEVYRKVMWN